MERQKQFGPGAASVRAARVLVSESLIATDDAAVAAVLVSELSSNAVDHARTSFTVGVSHDAVGALTVEVHDYSPAMPVLLPLEPGSVGLQLVDALVQEWGVRQVHDDWQDRVVPASTGPGLTQPTLPLPESGRPSKSSTVSRAVICMSR
jgi:two-component sensor histidine kinase